MHYPRPVHLQPAYANLGCKAGDFPASESFAAETLSLPIYPEMTPQQVQYVSDTIGRICEAFTPAAKAGSQVAVAGDEIRAS
jgi:dTDP-4-amino-4,6-dideoxygalactose transaminase